MEVQAPVTPLSVLILFYGSVCFFVKMESYKFRSPVKTAFIFFISSWYIQVALLLSISASASRERLSETLQEAFKNKALMEDSECNQCCIFITTLQ